MEEIYLLTKHAKFQSEYVENIPVYKRRFYLNMLKDEFDDAKKAQEKAENKAKQSSKRK